MAVINGRGTWGVRTLTPTVISTSSNWTRPADWLALNAPTDSTEQFTGLLAITNDDSNYVTLSALSTGNFTVDWGDGTVTSYASGATAYYKYDYSTISDATLSSRGYKQVVVKLTGTNVTQLHTVRPHTALSGTTNVLYTWLEYHVNLPNCTLLSLNRGSITNGAYQTWVEKVTLNKLASNFSTFNYQFATFLSLQEVVINATTTSVTTATQMFINCYYLKSVPLFNTSNIYTAISMFDGCYSLITIPSFNFVSLITAQSMFNNCFSLTSVPDLNFGNAANLNSTFNSCHNLATIGGLTTTNCTNFISAFAYCVSLETVPLFDTSKGTDLSSMFNGCIALTEVPAFSLNTSVAPNLNSMFYGCSSLKKIPLLDTQKATNFTSMFYGCLALTELPALNLTAGTNFTTMFTNTGGIAKAPFVNIRNTFTFAGLMLSKAAIVDIFNGLASGVTSKTITVSSNPGFGSLTSADRLIATAKGWTIA